MIGACLSAVMPGLEPGIQTPASEGKSPSDPSSFLDARVKPAHDGREEGARFRQICALLGYDSKLLA